MRVRCIAKYPNAEQIKLLGDLHDSSIDYDLDLEREYIVLGIGHYGGVTFIDLPTDGGWILSAPLLLFEIVDPRASRYWEVRYGVPERTLTLSPRSFEEPTFNSRLADDHPDAVEEYQRICRLLEEE